MYFTKLLVPITGFSNITGYNINMQKPVKLLPQAQLSNPQGSVIA